MPLNVEPPSAEELEVLQTMIDGLYLVTASEIVRERHWNAEIYKLGPNASEKISDVPDQVFESLKKRRFVTPVAVTSKFRTGMALTTWVCTSDAMMALEGFKWQTPS